jgi:hypothetical protein
MNAEFDFAIYIYYLIKCPSIIAHKANPSSPIQGALHRVNKNDQKG